MRIAMLAPLQESIPPENYGGIELIIYHLVEGLIKRGHEVTLFARSESKTSAKLVSLGIDKSASELIEDRYISGYLLASELANMSDKFDIIHNHAGWRFIMFAPKMKAPVVTTYHNLFYEKFHPLLSLYKENPYISISIDQQKKAPSDLKFIDNVYNGIDPNSFSFSEQKGDYLYWMARVIEKKGAHIAIQVAKATGKKLILAGPKVDDRPEDTKYFQEMVEPFIDNDQIKYVGPVDHKQKEKLYREALAFLNPIDWDEPFGLVVPESNATGTPIISYKMGAMSELIKDGTNGFAVNPGDVNGFIDAVKKIDQMDSESYTKMRRNSRNFFEENFTVEKMVTGYEEAYKKVLRK